MRAQSSILWSGILDTNLYLSILFCYVSNRGSWFLACTSSIDTVCYLWRYWFKPAFSYRLFTIEKL